MDQTPLSLLERLRFGADAASWERLVKLYTPLLNRWLRQYRLQPSDADDIVQEILRVVVGELPQFRHDLRRGAFRRWLRTIMVNRLRSLWRSRRRAAVGGSPEWEQSLQSLEDPESDLSRHWDEEHDRTVAQQLLSLVEMEFDATHWRAFRAVVLEGRSTAAVATELGLTANAVRIAKSRILSRLRVEANGLLD